MSLDSSDDKDRGSLRDKFKKHRSSKEVNDINIEGDSGSRPYEFAIYPFENIAVEGESGVRTTETIKKTRDNLLVPLFSNEPELIARKPVLKSEPRQSMSQLTVKSRPLTADPVIYPHILQQDSRD
jgi:hypothetical protein